MNEIFKENIQAFDSVNDPDYFFTREHQLRQKISIDLLEEVIDKESSRPIRLLSLACSTGIIEEQFKNRLGVTVFGVDVAVNSLKKASQRGIHPTCCDVSILPFESNAFDYVYAGEIIEHVYDVRRFLSEVNRVIKPNGYFVLTTPNLAKIDDRIKFLFGKAPRQVNPLHGYLYLHIRPFTYDLLKNSLETYGFSGTTLRTNVIRLDLFSRNITLYSKFLSNHFPGLGATLIVRCQKTSSTV